MNTLFITYTLEDYDDTYKKISKQLKSYSNWAKLFQRAWIIQTTKSTRQHKKRCQTYKTTKNDK